MNYFETNLEEISRSIQLLAQIFEYQVFELQVEEKDGNQTGYVPYMMNDAIEDVYKRQSPYRLEHVTWL